MSKIAQQKIVLKIAFRKFPNEFSILGTLKMKITFWEIEKSILNFGKFHFSKYDLGCIAILRNRFFRKISFFIRIFNSLMSTHSSHPCSLFIVIVCDYRVPRFDLLVLLFEICFAEIFHY